ncbi:hypothetical protein [Paraliomyxa miuraensis]|uniref:hypothetical protein n=1 Tax=Paraliomyxa miuraensis TaxID=376150 RepID=UPI00224FD52F|nr:hypothetical protein [Paraliomyxa miuraensis]MCX4247429.1 hypothetical protein [Paraliomyxa miuraensis]
MTETVVHLRWDGVYIPAAQQEHKDGTRLWRNSKALGECKGTHAPNYGRKTVYVRPGMQPEEAAVVREQRAKVAIIHTTANFAPGQEWTWVRASISNIHNVGSLVLQIRDRNGMLVYTERLSQDQVWGLPRGNQQPNAPAPPLQHQQGEAPEKSRERAELQWANPTGSPYQVRILITRRRAGAADSIRGVPTLTEPAAAGADHEANAPNPPADQTNVAIASLSLELVPWSELYQRSTGLPAATVPAGGVNRIKWVQYKLNELGWFAGKLDGVATNRDLERAIIRYRQSNRALSVQCFEEMVGDGVFRLKDPRTVISSAIDNGLIDELERDQQPRSTSEPGVFSGHAVGGARKIYLDAERFCRDAIDEFRNDSGQEKTVKAELEEEWFSTPRFPLRAKVMVTGSGGNAVWSPAVGQSTSVAWSWQSEPEDTNGLPNTPNLNTTKSYVERAKGEFQTPFHNAPEAVGGQISGNAAANMAVVFDGIDVAPTATTTGVTTTGPLVFFKPSTIAGDRYQITATVGGVHAATTSMMTLWRRIHITGHVSWGEDPSDVWDEVADKFAAAYMTIVPPTASNTKTMAAVAAVTDLALTTAFETRAGVGTWSDDAWDSRTHTPKQHTGTTPEEMTQKLETILDGTDKAYSRWKEGEDVEVDIGERYKIAMDLVTRKWSRGNDDESTGEVLTKIKNDVNLCGGADHYEQELKRIAKKLMRPSAPTTEEKPSAATTGMKGPAFLADIAKQKPSAPTAGMKGPAFLADIAKQKPSAPTAGMKGPAFLADIAKQKPSAPTALTAMKPSPPPVASFGGFGAPKPMQLDNDMVKGERGIRSWTGSDAAIENAEKGFVHGQVAAWTNDTRAVVHLKLEQHLGPGAVILEFVPQSDPVWYRDGNMMMGGAKVTINRAAFDSYKVDHLFTHELAHALFLKHYKHSLHPVKDDHDFSDDNCVMSYISSGVAKPSEISSTAAHYLPPNYDPKFCGKCNLKLRGWNIRAPGMPTKANDADPDPVVNK